MQINQSKETILSSARNLVEFIRKTRDTGNISNIKLSIITELMSYARLLADSNKTASILEDLCIGTILAYNNGEYPKYSSYLKEIIVVGEDL